MNIEIWAIDSLTGKPVHLVVPEENFNEPIESVFKKLEQYKKQNDPVRIITYIGRPEIIDIQGLDCKSVDGSTQSYFARITCYRLRSDTKITNI